MAPRLNSGNVVKLPARKAKGAKSSGGRKPASRLKAQPGQAKPRTPPQPSDADIRRDKQDRLIALRGKLLPIERKLATAQEAVSELRGEVKAVRAAIQNGVGIPLAVYDEADRKLKLKTKRTDQELYEKQRALVFEAFGLAVGPQPELDLEKVPEAARPGLHWRAVGYQAAIDGLFSDPQRDGVPPDEIQNYQGGFADGTAANARGIKALKKEDAKPKPPPQASTPSIPGAEAREGVGSSETPPQLERPDWSSWPQDPDAWSDVQKDAFTNWFDSLPEDADVGEIEHDGAALFFDRLVEATDEGGFEAPESELQAQNARRAVQEKREGAAEFTD